MELRHLVKEANLGNKHEDEGDRNPGIMPIHLIDGEFLLDVHDLEVQGEVWRICEDLGLLHFHLLSPRNAPGRVVYISTNDGIIRMHDDAKVTEITRSPNTVIVFVVRPSQASTR